MRRPIAAQFFKTGQTGAGAAICEDIIPSYRARLIPRDPFQTIDFDGVGALMTIGVEKGRATRPDLKIGMSTAVSDLR